MGQDRTDRRVGLWVDDRAGQTDAGRGTDGKMETEWIVGRKAGHARGFGNK